MTADPPYAAAVDLLTGWVAPDSGQAALAQGYLGFLAARPDALRRECVPGHLTASALVLDAARERVLLVLHRRLRRWLQPGGHCEPGDVDLPATALREATEESGIADLALDPDPVQLDVHAVTCSLGVPTRHFDVRFLAVAPAGAQARHDERESLDVRWFGLRELPDLDAGTHELIRLGLARVPTPR